MIDVYDLPVSADELAAGLVEYQVVDGLDVTAYLDEFVIGTDKGYLVDYNGDGYADEELRPLGIDLNGDGFEEWGVVVADKSLDTALDKPFASYTVSEAMLFIVGLVALLLIVSKCWRGWKV